jgi:TolB protein
VFVSQRAPDFQRVLLVGTPARGDEPAVLGELPEWAVPAPDGRRYARWVSRGFGRNELVVGERGETTIVRSEYGIADITWSPTGRRVAYTVADTSRCGPASRLCAVYELWVVDADGGNAHKIADAARLPTWSPDERRIAFAGEWNTYDASFGRTGKPYLASSAGGGIRALARIWGVDALAWSPRGDRLAVDAYRGFVAVVSARGADARKIGAGSAPAWSPRGELTFAGEGGIRIADGRGRTAHVVRANGVVHQIAWSANGRELAYVTAFVADARRPHETRKLVVTVRRDGRARRVVFRADRFAELRLAGWPPGAPGVRLTTTRVENDTDVFTMRGDGGDVRAVTSDDEWESEPAWSPDGRRIVFLRGFPGNYGFPQTAVHVVDARGGDVTRITSPTAGTDDRDPEWSPDGTWIVFSRSLAASGVDDAELFMCRPDGAGLIQLTRLRGSNAHPDWSPDGSRIAFSHSGELWTIRPDGSDARSIGLRGSDPSWSPDGSRIAYLGGIGNRLRLLVANADGSDHRVVSWDVEPMFSTPTWSPDGTRLVYEGMDGELHSIAVDGAGDVDLTARLGRDADPDWSGSAG